MRKYKDKIIAYWLNKLESDARFYFACGSNINQEQMAFGCNDALPVALPYVQNFKFFLNQ